MLNKLAPFTRGLSGVLVLAGLLAFMAPLRAEPVVNNSPAQSSNRLIDASQWLPGEQNLPSDSAGSEATKSATGRSPTAAEPLKEPADAPLGHALDRSTLIPPSTGPRPTQASAATPTAVANPPERDLRGAVKDAVRPLYEDVSNSDAAQALRSLHNELSLDKEQTLGGATTTLTSRPEGAGPSLDATTWEGQANREAPRTAAQVERDKVLASVMMDKLIDEVTPWAMGLVALYALYYLVKLVLAYGRHRTQRRRQGRVRRSRRSNPST